MLDRCLNPKNAAYEDYGGRGITVCDRWNRFSLFLEDMGERPSPEYSIEREKNEGPYSPENCCWATRTQQMRNTRRNRRVVFQGREMCLAELAQLAGMPFGVIRRRLVVMKMTVEQAVSIPVGSMRGRRSRCQKSC